jgi:ketosteroid isomerase-like protein
MIVMQDGYIEETNMDVLSSSLPTQIMVQETTQRKNVCIKNGILSLLTVSLLMAPIAIPKVAAAPNPAAGPTAESAMAAEEELTRAMRDNDADGIARSLSDDWAVISARGGVGEGKSIFPEGIKSGFLKHTAYEVSEPRVRLYGDVALVTTKVHNAGRFGGKPFDAMERQTDVWLWKDGAWKCVLTHEAWEGSEKDQKQLVR